MTLVALTDGDTVFMDANLRPVLRHKGIASKNTKGNWNVLCGDEIDIIKNGAETAGQICNILGFRYFNLKNLYLIRE